METANVVDSVSLNYRDGRSDKVYNLAIVEREDGLHTVDASWGRRGGGLQHGTKTQTPVSLAAARAVFAKVVAEKSAKGYTSAESGQAYARSSDEGRVTGYAPQLLEPIEEADLDTYLSDDAYLAQEKHDGRRLMVRATTGEIIGINRRGLSVTLAPDIAAQAERINRESGGNGILLDGELVGNTLVVFDLLELDGIPIREAGYRSRLVLLDSLLGRDLSGPISGVVTVAGQRAKTELVERLRNEGREGVVFKHEASRSVAGRGSAHVKLKFYETASFVVSHHNEQRSVGLAVSDGDHLVSVGNVTIPASTQIPSIGEVVEVRYLYAYPGGSVYQPTYLGTRPDVGREECVLGQLKFKPE